MKESWKQFKWIMSYARSVAGELVFLVLSGIVSSLAGVGIVWATKIIVDIATREIVRSLALSAVTVIALIAVKIISENMKDVLYLRVSLKASSKMKSDIFEKALSAQWLPLQHYHSGDYMARMNSDVEMVIKLLAEILPDAISLGAQFVSAFGLLWMLEPPLAVAVLAMVPVMLGIGQLFSGALRKLDKQRQGIYSKTQSFSQEMLQNALLIKCFDLQKKSIGMFNKLQNDFNTVSGRRNNIAIFSRSVFSVGYYAAYLAAMLWGAVAMMADHLTYGTMVAFLQLVSQVQVPAVSIVRYYPGVISALSSAERLMELQDIKSEDEGGKLPEKLTNVGISLDNISFSYCKDIVVSNVNLEILPGQYIALIGPSGRGKTTLVRILLALILPQEGQALLTSEEGSFPITPAARRYFSYIPQGNSIMSGTIEENLKMGREGATKEEMITALKAAAAWDFVSALADGLYTYVGEHGFGLSEGQAQRIAIARALLRDAPIMLMDEATSAIEVPTERRILSNIRQYYSGKTCLIISHRDSVMDYCDHIYKITHKTVEKLR